MYPGTFDPVTNGHLHIIRRAAALFDEVVVGVYREPLKPVLFSPEERLKLMREAIAPFPNVYAELYSGLTVEFARKIKAKVIIRGLRAGSDFEREFEMALLNKQLAPEIEVICLMADLKYQFLSSSSLKELVMLGGVVNEFAPPCVVAALKEKLGVRKV